MPISQPVAEDWYFYFLQKELFGPVGAEGWDMIFVDYFLSFLSLRFTHRHMDTFSIGPVVAAQQVIYSSLLAPMASV